MGHLRKSGFRSGYRRYTVPIIVTMKNLVARPSGLVNEVVLDMIWVKHWEYKSLITFKLLSLEMWKLYGYICLAKYFHKSIHILVFNKYFYKKKKSKLYFGNRIAVLNHLIDFVYQIGRSPAGSWRSFVGWRHGATRCVRSIGSVVSGMAGALGSQPTQPTQSLGPRKRGDAARGMQARSTSRAQLDATSVWSF
jgi:hypothetical protein